MKKYKIIELPEMVGKTLGKVKKYLEEKYPNQLAKEEDIEAFKAENPDLSNEWIWFYFFGSTFRRLGGHWCVPCVVWSGSGWSRSAPWLGDDWDSYDRVVLLVNEPTTTDPITYVNRNNDISPRRLEELLEDLADMGYLTEKGQKFRSDFWEMFIKEKN